ncbi:MAG: holin family protein [Brevibacillus sp.]|nr:holin family protein [Brevibacillus sp.]
MENFFKTLVAVGGAAASYLFGGWSSLLGVLLTFVVIDYVSGVIAAGVGGKLSSRVGLLGIAKKVFIFAMVAIAHLVDTALGDQHVLRDATIFFYLANELLSIIENAGRVGLPVPAPIQRAVEVLKGRGDQGGSN